MNKVLFLALIIGIPLVILAAGHFHSEAIPQIPSIPEAPDPDDYFPSIEGNLDKPTSFGSDYTVSVEYEIPNYTIGGGSTCDPIVFNYCKFYLDGILKNKSQKQENGVKEHSDIKGTFDFSPSEVVETLDLDGHSREINFIVDGYLEYQMKNQKIQQVNFDHHWSFIVKWE